MANENKFYINAVGTIMLVDTGYDISTATEFNLKIKKPSGKSVTWSGILGPLNSRTNKYSIIKYVVQEGDWDEPGWYLLQASVKLDDWSSPGELTKFQLYQEFK